VGDFLRSRKARTDRDPLFFVRVQSISSGMTLRDLSAVFCEALTGVMLPKVVTGADVVAMDALLTCLEEEHGLPVGSKLIYPILETSHALRNAYEIAMASPRVAYMGGALSRMGDIQQALGYHWTPEGKETLFLRSKVLVDARAAGVRYPISGMWAGRLDDLDGLRKFATGLRELGYYGMLLNSMSTGLVGVVHEVFTPKPEDVALWKEQVRLEDEAAKTGERALHGERGQGEGHVLHGSQVKAARMNLEWARALAAKDGREL
jgi:citrate lyase subunit beta/citryl-CoA lyase